MPRNTLSEYEVSIIKGLLQAGSRSNQEIAGLINRYRGDATRDVSTGRISNIKNGQIKKYQSISPASEDAVQEFLNFHSEESVEEVASPISHAVLSRLLKTDGKGSLKLDETAEIECKADFNKRLAPYLKTISGFANNRGGYFLFGIEDLTWKVNGLSEKSEEDFRFDPKRLNQICLAYFRREISIERTLFEIAGKKIGVLYVHEAERKPIIVAKTDTGRAGLVEGQTYYRYSGETRLIGLHELERIIGERISKAEADILAKISEVVRFGSENTALLNLTTGELSGAGRQTIVDASTLGNIDFLKEGEFDEVAGAPAIKVLGELEGGPVAYQSVEEEKYPFKPAAVASAVERRIGRRFTQNMHTNAYRFYKVRPRGNAKKKGVTDKRFAVFHKHSNGYTYSEDWIDFLVSEMTDDGQYILVRDFHRKR